MAATEDQVNYLVGELNRNPDISYERFITGLLGTHWEPARNQIVLNYVHGNRIIPKLNNSIRARFEEYFRRFYQMEGILAKMSLIENTLDALDMIPMQREPDNQCQYVFMEIIMARLVGKYLNFSSVSINRLK